MQPVGIILRGSPKAARRELKPVLAQAVRILKDLGIETYTSYFRAAINVAGGLNQEELGVLEAAVEFISEHPLRFSFLRHLDIEDRLVNFCLGRRKDNINYDKLEETLNHTTPRGSHVSFIGGPNRPAEMAFIAEEIHYNRGDMRTLSDESLAPFAEQVKALAQDQAQLGKLFRAAERYQAMTAWLPQNPRDDRINRRTLVELLLRNTPSTWETEDGQVAIPLAYLMDIANRTPTGLYQQTNALPVSSETAPHSNFYTLTVLPYWRQMMGRHAVKMARRFMAAGEETFTLIMVGDGSGQLGSSMALALKQAELPFRLVHLDPSQEFLKQQKHAYQQAGIPDAIIHSIMGSVLDVDKLLPQKISSFSGGFFVLHEVLDDLRTHALALEANDQYELAHVFFTRGDQPKSIGLPIEAPGLLSCLNHFSFYRPPLGQRVNIPFSIEQLLAIRNMMNCGDRVAFYAGDYGDHFIRNRYFTNPIRAYAPFLQNLTDYEKILNGPISLTADVDASLLFLAEGFGGHVERLTSNYGFLELVDPALKTRLPNEIDRIQGKLARHEYPQDNDLTLAQDSMFGVELISRGLFAALITKGI